MTSEHLPVHQSAATANDILEAVNIQTDPQLRVFLILLWLLAGRKNDVAKLRSRSVELLPDGRIQVFVHEGKGVRARLGKYHVISRCPPMWHQELHSYLAAARLADHKHLFRASIGKSSEALKALQAANPALCLRSVRRGAAQCLAQDPTVSVEAMVKITGHKSEKPHNALTPDAPDVSVTRLNDRRHLVWDGSHAITVDFKAYYHQFGLDPAVRNFFCMRLPMEDGSTKLYRLCVGATGQKHMVHTAVATTDLNLDYPQLSMSSDTQLDNIVWIGEPISILQDAKTFVERSTAVGATINDLPANLEDLVQTSVEWCGMVLNFLDKTVCVTKKSAEKLSMSWSGRHGWTWRGFEAHMGLLWWSMQVLKTPLSRFYNLLRFVSETSLLMEETRDQDWHKPADIPPAVWRDLQEWTEIATSNEPVRVLRRKSPEIFVLLDASAYGWGFVAYDTVTSTCYQYGAAWGPSFARIHHARLGKSTFTEPWAVLLTKEYLLPRIVRPEPSFSFGCDNAPTVYIFRKGFSSRSFDMNHAVGIDSTRFSRYQCTYTHIAGKQNILADAKSRGKAPGSTYFRDDEIIENLQRLLGDFPAGGHNLHNMPKGEEEDKI